MPLPKAGEHNRSSVSNMLVSENVHNCSFGVFFINSWLMGSVLQVYIKCNLKIELGVTVPNWGLYLVVRRFKNGEHGSFKQEYGSLPHILLWMCRLQNA